MAKGPVAWAAVALVVSSSTLLAQDAKPPSLAVQRLPDGVPRPAVDGALNDAAWEHASTLGELTQTVPIAGAPASEETRIRLLYDDRSIFLALECFFEDPSEIRGTQRLRDARLNPDDRIEMLFDTFHDKRNGFWFQIGAGGSKGDALISRNGNSFNKQWNGIWYAEVRHTDDGWSAELEIPFSTMNFSPDTTTWGFNIRRFVRFRNEEVRWASPAPRIGFFSLANAGTLHGIRDLQQGIGLDVVPFAVADYQRNRESDREFAKGDAGLDLYYRVTSNLKLSASFNTDFAETEVDERRINLTRFPLFFPEQRDFFLEDSGNFVFGPSSRQRGVQPFFSRRIGIGGEGEEVPLTASVKLTGQTDRFTVGLLDVQTESDGDLDGRNLFVGRGSMNVFDQSDVGIILTHGNPTGDARNDTYGADFNYRTDQFLGDRNLQFSTYFLRSDSEGVTDEDMAWYVDARYPNDQIELSFTHSVVEDQFRPALGFVPRTGAKEYRAGIGWNPRLNGTVRQLRFGLFPTLVTDTGNDLESGSLTLRPLRIDFEEGDELSTRISRTTERLPDAFDIQDDITIEAGRYDETRYGVELETASLRPLEVRAGYSFGGFFGGERNDIEVGATYRPGPWGSFSVDYERNDVQLDAGDFTVRIWRARANVVFTPLISWSNFIQYDNVSEGLGLNSRLWWIVRPGKEVFFVVNQGWQYGADRRAPTVTQVTAKVGYTFRF